MDWDTIYSQLRQNVKLKLQGLEKLHDYIQDNALKREQVSSLLDASGQLLGDSNFKVALKTLQCWQTLVQNEGDIVRPYVNSLVPQVVERLGDARQEVRQAACNLLLELLQVFRPDMLIERLQKQWAHKNWKVRHGLLQFVAEAVCMIGDAALACKDEQYSVLHQVIKLVEDSESAVRDAAIECLEEVYKVLGEQLVDVISSHNLRPAHLREIYSRISDLGPLPPAAYLSDRGTPLPPQPVGGEAAGLEGSHDAGYSSRTTAYDQRGAAAGGAASAAAGASSKSQGMREAVDTYEIVDAKSYAAGPTQRRGGYKDGGGVTADGVLPEAQALCVHSDRELQRELDQIQAVLAGGTGDWDKRIAAMVRFEGLVKGGAAGFEGFSEALKPLASPLVDQLSDRRSAVSRQAAHLLEVLAAGMGPRFENYLGQFLGPLFKVLPITVQVVSDAADACVRALLYHCPTPKVVPLICETLLKDKNPKIRQHCAVYLLLMLEELDPSVYHRHLAVIESGLQAAVTDALNDTRTAGRTAVAAYTAALPDRALALTKRFDSSLQTKIRETAAQYRRGAYLASSLPGMQPPAARSVADRKHAPSRTALTAVHSSADAGRAPSRSSSSASLAESVGANESSQANGGLTGYGQSSSSFHKPPRVGMGKKQLGGAGGAGGLSSSASIGRVPSSGLAGGGGTRPGRKSVAGVPMRVPGPAGNGYGLLQEGGIGTGVAASTAPGFNRRASALPQRVLHAEPAAPPPHNIEDPATAAAAMRASSLASEAVKVALPATPGSSGKPAAEHGGLEAGAGMGLAGGPSRQQGSMHAGHGLNAAGLARAASGSDDLNGISRDQQQLQQQSHHHQQQQRHRQQEQQQQSLRAESSNLSTIFSAPAGPSYSSRAGTGRSDRSTGIGRAVVAILSNPKDWREKVAAFEGLVDALNRQMDTGASHQDFWTDIERVLPKLLIAIDDAHFKVSLAALAATQAALSAAPRALEGHLDKLMPLLFLKLCASKLQTRVAAEGALKACAAHFDANMLLAALSRSIDAMKQPAAKVSVMEFLVLYLGEGKVAGVPTNPLHYRQWLSRNVPLLLDKCANIRLMAVRAVHAIASMDLDSVLGMLNQCGPQEGAAIEKAIMALDGGSIASSSQRDHSEGSPSICGSEDAEGYGHGHGYNSHARGAFTRPASVQRATLQQQEERQQQQQVHHQQEQQYIGQAEAAMRELDLRAGGGNSMGAGGAGPMGTSWGPGSPAERGGPTGVSQYQQQTYISHQQASEAWSSPQRHAAAAVSSSTAAPVASGLTSSPGAVRMPPSSGVTTMVAAGTGRGGGVYGYSTPPPSSSRPASSFSYARDAAAAAAGGNGVGTPAASGVTHHDVLGRSFITSPGHLDLEEVAMVVELPSDPMGQARHLTVLVHRLTNKPSEEALAELAACAKSMCKEAWDANFSKVLLAALSCTHNSHEPTREMAYVLIRQLARYHANHFEPVLDVALQPLLEGCSDGSREVLMAAHQALERLMDAMPPQGSLDILRYKLPSQESISSGTAVDGDVLCATIRCVQRAAARLHPSELMEVAPGWLLPGLFAAFQHPRPDVRKVVVFCLVDMWINVGESLTPYLSSLATSQLKLLTIYYNRALEARQAAAAAAAQHGASQGP